MNRLPKSLMLSLILSTQFTSQQAQAMGAKAPPKTPPSESPLPTPPRDGNALIDLGLNLAISYAKKDPRYSAILSTLGINNASDLKALLKGNANGTNFASIVARLAFLQLQSDSNSMAKFSKIGISDEKSLRNFLSTQSGSGFEEILTLALKQAMSNPKYATWMERLNISDVQDLKNLLKGNGDSGNLLPLVLNIAMNYAESNSKYAQYVPIIQAAMSALGIDMGGGGSGGGGSDDDIIDLGPYNGMTKGEVKAVRR